MTALISFVGMLLPALVFTQTNKDSANYIHYQPIQQFFQSFGGGINTLYDGKNIGGSFDLSVQTLRYFLITGTNGKLSDTINFSTKSDISNYFKGLDFLIINRASIEIDSLRAIANDYLTSLQASPLTFRLNKEIKLNQRKPEKVNPYSPKFSLLLTGDGRVVPYSARTSKTQVGASGHFYLTFLTRLRRFEMDRAGKLIDDGYMYFRPAFGIAMGSNELMNSIIRTSNPVLMSSEVRVGFISNKQSIQDCCLLVRHVITPIYGPNTRIGLVLNVQ